MYDKWCMEPLQVDGGVVHPPDRPGLGIELNDEVLSELRVG
jgi:L-alanine-DL-glutamate epimerase-like enolase superfamily enzyme